MSKSYQKLIICSLVLFAGLTLGLRSAHAFTIFDNSGSCDPQTSCNNFSVGESGSEGGGFNYWAFKLGAIGTVFSNQQLFVSIACGSSCASFPTSTASVELVVCNSDDSASYFTFQAGGCSGTTVDYFADGDGITPYSVANGIMTWSFSNFSNVTDANDRLWFVLGNQGADAPWFGAGHTVLADNIANSPWAGWDTTSCGTGGNGFPSSNPCNYPFLFVGTGVPVIAPLSFVFPAPGATINDFSNWLIETSGVQPGTLQIQYSNASGGSPNGTDTITYSPFVNTDPVPITKSQPLFFPPLLPPISYNATATLYDSSGSVQFVATTTFTITLAGGETSSTIPTTSNCQFSSSSFFADPVGNIQNGICNALTFLFIPNTPQKNDLGNRFQGIWTGISGRVPFGYVTAIQSGFAGFTEGTNTSTLISTSTYASLSGVFGPLKNGLTVLFWFLGGTWLFHFARNIHL